MRLDRLYRIVSTLVDATDVTLVCQGAHEGDVQYRAQAHLRKQIGSGIMLVQSGFWYSQRGAERELLRMLRGLRLERKESE